MCGLALGEDARASYLDRILFSDDRTVRFVVYLLLAVTIAVLLLLALLVVAPGMRRLRMICPSRASSGGGVLVGFEEEIVGLVFVRVRGVISSRAVELRRRL